MKQRAFQLIFLSLYPYQTRCKEQTWLEKSSLQYCFHLKREKKKYIRRIDFIMELTCNKFGGFLMHGVSLIMDFHIKPEKKLFSSIHFCIENLFLIEFFSSLKILLSKCLSSFNSLLICLVLPFHPFFGTLKIFLQMLILLFWLISWCWIFCKQWTWTYGFF